MRRFVLTLTFSLFVTLTVAAAPSGKTYSSPEKAVDAFIAAFRAQDVSKMLSIFGKSAQPLFVEEDSVSNETNRTKFLALYDEKHVLTDGADGSKILVVGEMAWPLPIPIVKTGSKWAFDTEAGIEEILNRRIGRNELTAIQTSLAIADAEREYFVEDRDGDGILEFAQSFHSTVGLRNGLFWPVQPGEPQSPLGPLVAWAAIEGYLTQTSPYHGYNFRLLSSQGASAEGGAYDYVAHGNQIGGFAILAYPAKYGETGVMSFMVSHSGVVYQRDLGKDTATAAQKIEVYEPNGDWVKVPESDLVPLPPED